MPKIPRDISGKDLAKLLSKYGYKITRQTGSHIRLTSNLAGLTHQITIPHHSQIKIGTLNKILNEIAGYLKTDKESIVKELFKS
jgi:predicted RNA binding protein YcfA (HicA-like mRNA interferase family)